jgi:hypothetical protein
MVCSSLGSQVAFGPLRYSQFQARSTPITQLLLPQLQQQQL